MDKKLISIICKRLKHGDNVMELGCGNGNFVNALTQSFENLNKVIAVDLYSKPEKLNDKIVFLKQDLESFTIDEKFDFVIIKHVLEHIKNPLGLLERIKKNLKKQGKILIVVPNRHGYRNEAKVYLPEHGKHYFLWDQESLQFSLERLGFTCRFHDLFSIGTNSKLLKIGGLLLGKQNSNLICVASLDN